MYSIWNGNLIDSQENHISATSEGVLYGYGLFETLKVVDGNIFFLEEHLERMIRGCNELNMLFSYDLKRIKEYCDTLIDANKVDSGSLKIVYSKNKEAYDLMIHTGMHLYTKERYEKGFRLCFADSKRNPFEKLAYIKSNNYLGNLVEKQGAIEKGYDEAVFLNTNHKISEGTFTNIFFVKDGCVFMPSVQCGILPGIMRAKIIRLIKDLNLELYIGEYDQYDLLDAAEVFLTNSLMEIMPVNVLENKKLDLEENRITQSLRRAFCDFYYK